MRENHPPPALREIDLPILKDFVLPPKRREGEDEVRTALILDDLGGEYGIGVWQADEPGLLMVVAAGHGERTGFRGTEVAIEDLNEALESMYRSVEGWIAESGQTKAPVLGLPDCQPSHPADADIEGEGKVGGDE